MSSQKSLHYSYYFSEVLRRVRAKPKGYTSQAVNQTHTTTATATNTFTLQITAKR